MVNLMKRRWAMERYWATVILACFFFIPSFLTAAEIDAPRLFGVFSPKPGAWSEYAILDKSTGQRSFVRISIVDIEADAYWYEVENRGEGGSNIVKMLVTGDPGAPHNIQRLILKKDTSHAWEIDLDFTFIGRRMASRIFEQWSGTPSGSTVNLRNAKTGAGTATVPGGTFDVNLHQIVDKAGKVYAKYKFSEDVHPFGVIASDAENATMVLVGHGTGAESFITGKPAIIKPSPEMLEGMLRGMFPDMGSPQDMIPSPGNNIRQIPGMGRGYEPKQ
jgi:hypothetical protein